MDEDRLNALQSLRRHIAEDHPDGPAKERFLRVLDEMILEQADRERM